MNTTTKGPWRLEAKGPGWYIVNDAGFNVAALNALRGDALLMASAPDLLAMLTRLQVALGNFCCDNCISYDDMEESHTELLDASIAADELVKKVRGQE